MTLALKEVIEELDQKVLVDLLTEEELETPIGKRIDELSHTLLFVSVLL